MKLLPSAKADSGCATSGHPHFRAGLSHPAAARLEVILSHRVCSMQFRNSLKRGELVVEKFSTGEFGQCNLD